MAMVWYEIKKILVRPSCQIALLILLLLAGQSCYRVIYGAEGVFWVNEDGQEEKGFAAAQKLRAASAEWSGTLDQEMLEKALAELKQISTEAKEHPEDLDYAYKKRQGLEHIRGLLNNSFNMDYSWDYGDYFLAETLEPEQLSEFYDNRVNQLKNWLYDKTSTGYELFSEDEKQYMINCYESLDTPLEVGYTAGWEKTYYASYYVILYGTILMAFLISGVFANESRWKADSIFFSTELGRKKGTAAKLAAGFLFTTAVYWLMMALVNLVVLSCLGFEGANCPLQSSSNFWKSTINITYLQRSMLQLADGYLLWMFLSGLVMMVSAISSSLSLSVTVPSLLILATDILGSRGYIREASKWIRLFPHAMASAYGNETIVLYSVFGRIVTPITIQRLLYSVLTILIVILCYRTYRRKQIH